MKGFSLGLESAFLSRPAAEGLWGRGDLNSGGFEDACSPGVGCLESCWMEAGSNSIWI